MVPASKHSSQRARLRKAGVPVGDAPPRVRACGTATAASALVRSRDRSPVLDGNTYTVVAPRCVLADALTKVVAQTGQIRAPYLERFGATAIITPLRSGAA